MTGRFILTADPFVLLRLVDAGFEDMGVVPSATGTTYALRNPGGLRVPDDIARSCVATNVAFFNARERG